jgi:AcrR family transcriptional regulator
MQEQVNIDRRVIRTKQAIQDALIDLVEENGFDSISIKDITERADINRGTFYLHYHDKYDLLDQTEEEIIKDIKEIIQPAGAINLEKYLNSDEPFPMMIDLFNYIKSRSRLMHAVLGLKTYPGFQTRIKKALETNFFYQGFFSNKSSSDLLVPADYLISYVAAAHMGVIQSWLVNDCRESPLEMARILSRLSFLGPLRAIKPTTGLP